MSPTGQPGRARTIGCRGATRGGLSLDGRPATAEKGELIIAAAERAGTFIPRFCYHPRMRAGGHVPHVPRRGRAAPGARRCSRPASSRCSRTWRSPPTPTRSRRRRTACSSSCSSTTLSTARCATRAASARCRTRPWPTARASTRFVEEKRHFEKPIALSELVLLDRERCIQCSRCTRFADEVAGEAQIDFQRPGRDARGQHLLRATVLFILLGEHRADLPGGGADGHPLSLHGPTLGPRPGRDHVHDVRLRLSRGGAVVGQPRHPVAGPRLGPGQPELALRQGPVRLRVDQRAGAHRRTLRPQGRRAGGRVLARGPGRGGRRVARGSRAARPGRRTPAPMSGSSVARVSPTRAPMPGPVWPRGCSAPTRSMHSWATGFPPRWCSDCPAPPSTRRSTPARSCC